jgi:hypothetical protein
MKLINTNNSKRLFFLDLEHATLYRRVGDVNTAIKKLNTLLSTLTDEEEITDAQYWLCIIETEREILLGNIPPQNICSYSVSCDTSASSVKSQLFNNGDIIGNQSANEIILTVIPNPVTSQSVINAEIPDKNSATIEIINVEGKTVKTFGTNEQKTIINVRSSDLPKGIYSIKLTVSTGHTKTTRMIIQ